MRAKATILSVLFCFAPLVATAYDGQIKRDLAPEKKIAGLDLLPEAELTESESIPSQPKNNPNMSTVFRAVIRGRFVTREVALLLEGVKVNLEKDGTFNSVLPLKGSKTRATFTTIDLRGNLQSEVVEISYDPSLKPFAPGWRVTPSLGLSSIAYQQSGITGFSEIALTVKVGVQRVLSPRWDLAFTGFLTALPLTTSVPGNSIQFLGLNLRAGWDTRLLKREWKFSLLGGIYYTTSFTSGGTFGYANLEGPQIFPALSYRLKSGDTLGIYLKFSPVSSGFQLQNLSSREIAAGVNYSLTRRKNHFLSGALDISQLQLNQNDISVQSNSVSLSVGYSL